MRNKRLEEAIARELRVRRGGQIWLACFMSRKSYTEYAPTITTRTIEDNNNFIMEREEPFIVASRGREPQVMTPKRTEYGKQIRKQYEAGEIEEQRKNIQKLEPRTDGVTNTLTSVQKDNLVCEPINTDSDGNARTINSHYPCMNVESVTSSPRDGYGYVRTAVQENYRIRKLTERECFRLMDVSEDDIDKIQAAGISRSQQYKMAGNSIVVSCLYHIIDKLFINKEITDLELF